MIRQLPKLSVPSFVRDLKSNVPAIAEGGADVKIYDVITDATVLNSEGNTLQLQLFQKDSDVTGGERELHGRLVLSTSSVPEAQDLSLGFAFAETNNKEFFDGLSLTTRLNDPWNKQFKAIDTNSAERPDIYESQSNQSSFIADKDSNWLVRHEESS